MVIEKPSLQVFQNFQSEDTSSTPDLNAVIIGPNYNVISYTDKEDCYVGEYDNSIENTFNYPNAPSNSSPDITSVKVYLDEAKLKYFEKEKDTGDYEFRIVNGYKNRIRTCADDVNNHLIFKNYTNIAGTVFNRSSVFDGRDVTIGDVIEVTDGTNTTITTVYGITNETLDSSIEDVTDSISNQGNQAHSIGTITYDEDNTGDDTVTTSGTYVGSLQDNVLSDTYTVEVTQAGTIPATVVTANPGNTSGDDVTINSTTSTFDNTLGDTYTVAISTGGVPGVAKFTYTSLRGDNSTSPVTITAFATDHALGTKGLYIRFADATIGGDGALTAGESWEVAAVPSNGRLRVTSSSGIDNVTSRVFPGFGKAFSIGALGAKITITDGGDSLLTLGDIYTFNAYKAIAKVVAESSGEYTGIKDLDYIVEVTQGGEWGTCEITTTSSSVDSSGPTVVPNYGEAIVIGNYGVEIAFETNSQGGLIKGDRFLITANSSKNGGYKTLILKDNLDYNIINNEDPILGITTPNVGNSGNTTAVISGDYSDDNDVLSIYENEVYTIEITTTGVPGVAKYSVTTTSGKDDSINNDIVAYGSEQSIGSLGLKITFTQVGGGNLTDGDKWTISISKQNLSCTLKITKNNIELPRYREDIPTEFAWDPFTANVKLYDSIKLTDSTRNSGTVPLDVEYGKVYVSYRSFMEINDTIKTVSGSSTLTQLEEIFGTITPESVLGYGVYMALRNSSGKSVQYLGIDSNDSTGWSKALTKLEKENSTYYLVALTDDVDIIELFKEHINKMSDESAKKWRRCFDAPAIVSSLAVYDRYYDQNSQEYTDYTAVVIDNPTIPGTLYNHVEFNPEQGIDLFEDVSVGNTFRFNYSTDINGNEIYTEYIIDSIISSTICTISPALTTDVPVLSKFKIYKALSKDEKVDYAKTISTRLTSRRMCHMFPETWINDNDEVVKSYFGASAVAGLKLANLIHQPITNYNLVGIKSVPLSYQYYTEDDLDELANSGWFILTQDYENDIPYIRHQLTGDVSQTAYAELSVGCNVDEISYVIANDLIDIVGKWNITDLAFAEINYRIEKIFETKKYSESDTAGPQLIDSKIVSISRSAISKTKVELVLEYTVPAPMNNIVVQQTINI